MIKAEKLSYSFPQKDLYNKISFTLEDDVHCAFIGTLLSDHNVKIHQYEYGRCFRMKIREDCVNLSDVMFGLTVYVHS